MDGRRRSPARLLAPIALITFVFALLIVIAGSDNEEGSSNGGNGASQQQSATETTPGETTTTTGEVEPRVSGTFYTVKTGDTLGGIAETVGIPITGSRSSTPNSTRRRWSRARRSDSESEDCHPAAARGTSHRASRRWADSARRRGTARHDRRRRARDGHAHGGRDVRTARRKRAADRECDEADDSAAHARASGPRRCVPGGRLCGVARRIEDQPHARGAHEGARPSRRRCCSRARTTPRSRSPRASPARARRSCAR